MRHKYYSSSSEKLKKRIKEIELQIEEGEVEIASDECAEAEITDLEINDNILEKEDEKAKRTGRKKLPDNLAREEIVLNPEEQCPGCGSNNMRKISDDVSEVLEYVPSSFKVIRYIRPRCACNECDKIVQAYAASKTIDKGKAGAGLLAHILIQKYCNHLPLYRQSEMYKREDIEISRSTMAGWVGQCSKLLEPLVEEIRKTVFASSQIHGDDTPVRVLAPGRGKTKIGRLWCYVRDGRNHGDNETPAVCYYYSPDRKGSRPLEHLLEYKGVLHADAYSGYDKLYKNEDGSETAIEESACWSHARRKFYEITIINENAKIAEQVVLQISELYKIESAIRGIPSDERLEHRQKYSKDIVDKLFTYIKSNLKKLPKKGETVKAINYALNNEQALKRFLENGKVEIDNNAVERAIKPVALGRKNWMFAGSDTGGERAANIYTIIETAKMNKLNPWKHLRTVLANIQDHNSSKLADLLPWNIII